MDKAVISDKLTSLINGQKVAAGVFTTYNFEPEFFELDVIPLLLPSGIPLSSDDRVKTFQVREALRDSGLQLEIFYDLPIFRQSAERSPAMEYLCHGVHNGNNAFHAKSIFLLLEQDDNKPQRLLVAAGSNNLTRAGWWENIEVQHWEEIVSGETQRAFLNRLGEDVDWLIDKRGLKANSALEQIKKFIAGCRGANDAKPVQYYGPSNSQKVFSFFNSVRSRTLGNDQNWTLEIISPFFSEDPKNKLHDWFFKHFGVKSIRLLLPQDQEGIALCDEKYYFNINAAEGVSWAHWRADIGKALGTTAELFRRVHAKIYHFYNEETAWAFVGSVNFSHKAFRENVEAGFFVKLETTEPLLEAILEDEEIEKFEPPIDGSSNPEESAEAASLPELHLKYDWLSKQLKGRTSVGMQYEVCLKNAEGEVAVGPWLVGVQEEICSLPVDRLEEMLHQGSLITVCGQNAATEEVFSEHKVLLQQTGWTHKPVDLPNLSPEQILEIYAGMSEERRQLMLMNAKIQQLVLRNMGGEMTIDADDAGPPQFFCEYAEIFHAFRMFRQRLHNALENSDDVQVDYYLTGAGTDSLPALLERGCDRASENFKGVTAYLLLLSVRDIYREACFAARPKVAELLADVEAQLSVLKNGETIRLGENSPDRRASFFAWFEKQFSKEYVSIQAEQGGDDEIS